MCVVWNITYVVVMKKCFLDADYIGLDGKLVLFKYWVVKIRSVGIHGLCVPLNYTNRIGGSAIVCFLFVVSWSVDVGSLPLYYECWGSAWLRQLPYVSYLSGRSLCRGYLLWIQWKKVGRVQLKLLIFGFVGLGLLCFLCRYRNFILSASWLKVGLWEIGLGVVGL